jgi:hypothetical protein
VPTTSAWWPVPVAGVRCRQHEPERFLVQRFEGEPGRPGAWVAGVLVADDQIERAEPELGQRLLELELGDLQPDVRVVGAHARPGRAEEAAGGGLQAAGPYGAADLAGQRGQVGAGGIRLGQQHAGVPGQQPAGVGQPNAPTGPVEQPHPDLLLQDAELLGDRGRRVAERGRDGGEGASLLQLAEHPEPAQIERDHVGTLTRPVQ